MIKSILKKNLAKQLAIVCLLASFFIAQSPIQDMVLCIEANGHVEVEAKCTPDSVKISRGEIGSFFKKVESGDHCGPCVDIPISIGNPAQQYVAFSASVQQIDAPQYAVRPLFPLVIDRTLRNDPHLYNAFQKDTTLASIRSVVIIV